MLILKFSLNTGLEYKMVKFDIDCYSSFYHMFYLKRNKEIKK